MRQWGEGVVAHVLASRLLRVANKFTLLIVVDGFAADGSQHDAEDDQDGQPDLSHKGGMVGDLVQQTCQETPAHGASLTGELIQLWRKRNHKILSPVFWLIFSFSNLGSNRCCANMRCSAALHCLLLGLHLSQEWRRRRRCLYFHCTNLNNLTTRAAAFTFMLVHSVRFWILTGK